MKATIDNLDLNVYRQYAINQTQFEEFSKDLRLDYAANIAKQIEISNVTQTPTHLADIMGLVPANNNAHWAFFLQPEGFSEMRFSPFVAKGVAPTLGGISNIHQLIDKTSQQKVTSSEEESEKQAIITGLDTVASLNSMHGSIVGRMLEFLKG